MIVYVIWLWRRLRRSIELQMSGNLSANARHQRSIAFIANTDRKLHWTHRPTLALFIMRVQYSWGNDTKHDATRFLSICPQRRTHFVGGDCMFIRWHRADLRRTPNFQIQKSSKRKVLHPDRTAWALSGGKANLLTIKIEFFHVFPGRPPSYTNFLTTSSPEPAFAPWLAQVLSFLTMPNLLRQIILFFLSCQITKNPLFQPLLTGKGGYMMLTWPSAVGIGGRCPAFRTAKNWTSLPTLTTLLMVISI